jgi:heat shock protein HspQ
VNLLNSILDLSMKPHDSAAQARNAAIVARLAELQTAFSQNLLADETGEPVGHPQTPEIFEAFEPGRYRLRPRISN